MFSKKAPFNIPLLMHSVIYALTLFFFLQSWSLITKTPVPNIFYFTGINFILHFLTDGIVSNFTKIYLKRFDYGSFFVVLGLDQTIHILTLVNTL